MANCASIQVEYVLVVSAVMSALVGPKVACVRKRAAAAGAFDGPAAWGDTVGLLVSVAEPVPLPPPHAANRASQAAAAAVREKRACLRADTLTV